MKEFSFEELNEEQRKRIFEVSGLLLNKNFNIAKELTAELVEDGALDLDEHDVLHLLLMNMVGVVANENRLDNCLFVFDNAHISIMYGKNDGTNGRNPFPELRESMFNAVKQKLQTDSDTTQKHSIH